MGSFNVVFGNEVIYNDPEYQMIIHLNVAGNATVTCEERAGGPDDVLFVKDLITAQFPEQFSLLSGEKVPYRDLVSHKDTIIRAIADVLKEKNIVLNSFAFVNIAPNECSQQAIKDRDKLKAYEAMSQEDKNKMLEDAMNKYKATMGAVAMGAAASAASAAPTAKFCTNCGSKADGGKFCSNCGSPLTL